MTKPIPKNFAYADTILLFKSGDPENLANYRPISFLSTLYKVLTKLITQRIENIELPALWEAMEWFNIDKNIIKK
ncbi:hypothetical protein OESDEN_17839 [Oesophagostomum dentatum]|uniref:Reverse transcriptase domain-containing protein n=1 Tax=Oesophagostomum dentatum TaxID=61180 RepID=A0A0B1SG03_OESDE|nr:hypothetical protein OESDEN_17839 [Oesophagostomum dentatum]